MLNFVFSNYNYWRSLRKTEKLTLIASFPTSGKRSSSSSQFRWVRITQLRKKEYLFDLEIERLCFDKFVKVSLFFSLFHPIFCCCFHILWKCLCTCFPWNNRHNFSKFFFLASFLLLLCWVKNLWSGQSNMNEIQLRQQQKKTTFPQGNIQKQPVFMASCRCFGVECMRNLLAVLSRARRNFFRVVSFFPSFFLQWCWKISLHWVLLCLFCSPHSCVRELLLLLLLFRCLENAVSSVVLVVAPFTWFIESRTESA